MFRIIVIPLALLGLLIAALVWSGGGTTERADFAFINRGDIYTLDLNRISYMQDFRLAYGIREGLYALDSQSLRPAPAGALSHTLSADKKTWTFHLRPDCRWSNGDPVTARDYEFSWRRLLEEPGEYTYLYYSIRNAQEYEKSFAAAKPLPWDQVGIKAVDDLTFRVTLSYPVTYFLELVAFPPFYPRHERSMAPFREYVDTDVINPLTRYLDAARKVEEPATPWILARAAGERARILNPQAVAPFVRAAKSFDIRKATAAELQDILALFSALNPLEGIDAEKVRTNEGKEPDPLAGLTPKEQLRRMVAGRFLRYMFDRAYTRPPHVVTNGPFELTRWDFKRRLILKKCPHYWDRAKVRCNTIELVVSESPQHQLLMYETGQVDWLAEVLGQQAGELRKLGRTDLRASPAFGTMFLTLMCRPELPPPLGGGKNPLADVRVRQAMAMVIDKRFIVDQITRMGELPARTYLPPDGTLPDFTWKPGPAGGKSTPYTVAELQTLLSTPAALTGPGPGLRYDPESARKLLAEAGFPNGQGFKVLPILYNTDNDMRRQIAQVLKEHWKRELNIDIDIRGVEGKIFSDMVSKKEYAIATVSWYGDYPDVSTFTDKFLSSSLQNDSAWEQPDYDQLCERAAREPDAARRNDMLSQAEHRIDTEMPIIPIFHYVNVSINRDHIHGVLPNPRSLTFFKDVWVERK